MAVEQLHARHKTGERKYPVREEPQDEEHSESSDRVEHVFPGADVVDESRRLRHQRVVQDDFELQKNPV